MKKGKSSHKTKNMVQTAVWLPYSMRDDLKRAAGGEGEMGNEIRRRLQISLKADQSLRDKRTTELINAIMRIDGNLPVKPWHEDRLGFEVFKAALSELLAEYQPKSEVQSASAKELQNRYGENEKPETVGRILARAALMAARDEEKE
jgi:hypothetical protein